MSDLLIRGMEMPKSCGYCPFRHEARDGDECYLGASLTEYQKRPDDCPLVPVPPHGRLIDGDVAEVISYVAGIDDGGDFADGILYAADWISKQPTIVQAEP